jgi:hypothetical protein
VASRRRILVRWTAILVAAAVFAGAAFVARAVMPGARFLERMSAPAERPDRAGAHFTVREVAIPSPARVYEPAAGHERVIVLLHGLHWRGYDEERLVLFARTLAGMGFAVVTPDIEELRNFDIDAGAVDAIERACLWTLDESGLLHGDPRIGLMGICFSGGLGLSAATRPTLRGRLAYLFTFGSHGDLDRTIEYLASGRLPNGTILPPHPYGQAVLLRRLAERLVPPRDVEALRAGALDILRGDEAAARAMLGLCLERKTDELGARIAPHLAGERTPDLLSPVRLPPPDCPLFVLHGCVDNVVPPSEAEALGRWCPGAHVLVSDLVVHVELDRSASPSWSHYLELAAFWSQVLRS